MSKRTEELFKLHRQIEELQEQEKQLKSVILQEEIVAKDKEGLQDRYVVVRYCRGTDPSVSIDCKAFEKAEPGAYAALTEKYPKLSMGKDPYYTWTFAKDK